MDQKFHEYAEVDSQAEAFELQEEGWTLVKTKQANGKTFYILGRNPGRWTLKPSQVHPLHKGHTWIGLILIGVGGFFLFFSQGSGFGILSYSGFDQILIGLGLVLFFFGVFEFRGEK